MEMKNKIAINVAPIIESIIERQDQKVEDEVKNNSTVQYCRIKSDTIKQFISAYSEEFNRMMMELDELNNEETTIYNNKMYIQGLKDGINLIIFATGTDKIKIFGELL